MKTRTKVILDDWFGRMAVVLLNIAARILGKILRIDHSISKKPDRIAVCKLLGMGSIIQATPLLQTLKYNFPEAEIVFVTSKANKSLVESIKVIDAAVYIDDKSIATVFNSTFKALFNFWKRRINLYLDLETYSYYSTALATLSCATNRFGFYRVERNIRMGVHTHMMFFNQRASIAQSYLQMARAAGCVETIDALYHFEIAESTTQKLIEKFPVSGKYIVINPNASDLRTERRWPAEKFITLSKELIANHPEVKQVYIGSSSERNYVNQIVSEINHALIIDTSGQLSLSELIAIINGAILVITNDTGPMHISYSLEKKTISLFGPASPMQYGQNKFAFGIYKNVYCSPCVHDFLVPPCKGDNQCMKQISVDEVMSLVEVLLNGQNPGSSFSDMNFFYRETGQALGKITR